MIKKNFYINILGQYVSKTKPQTSPVYGNGDGYGFGHEDAYADVYGSTNNHYQGNLNLNVL